MDKNKREELAKQFKKTTDKLGMSIDSGIFDLIVTLNALGFPTSASCEGHLDRGVAAPWVDIQPKMTSEIQTKKEEMQSLWREIKKMESEGKPKTEIMMILDKFHQIEKEVNKPLLLMAEKLMNLLNEFYKSYSTEAETMLIMRKVGSVAIRMESQGAIVQEVKTKQVKEGCLLKYQSEMEKFSAFVKNKLIDSNK